MRLHPEPRPPRESRRIIQQTDSGEEKRWEPERKVSDSREVQSSEHPCAMLHDSYQPHCVASRDTGTSSSPRHYLLRQFWAIQPMHAFNKSILDVEVNAEASRPCLLSACLQDIFSKYEQLGIWVHMHRAPADDRCLGHYIRINKPPIAWFRSRRLQRRIEFSCMLLDPCCEMKSAET